MIKNFDGKELTHLRFLADSIAAKPEDADELVAITLSVVKPSRESDPAFVEYLAKLKDDLSHSKDPIRVKLLANNYAASKDSGTRRIGEILLWALEHKRNRVRR